MGRFSLTQLLAYSNILMGSGAGISAYFFAKILQVPFDLKISILMGAATWCVYTFDHYLDVQNTPSLWQPRRKFFKKYQPAFLLLMLIIGVFCGIAAYFWLTKSQWFFTILVGILCLGYFLGAHFIKTQWFRKEWILSIIITLVIVGFPSLGLKNMISVEHLIIIISFYILLIADIFLFSMYDMEMDSKEQMINYLHLKNAPNILFWIRIGLVLCLLLWIFIGLFFQISLSVILILLSQGMVVSALAFFPNYFQQKDRFRFWGDVIFSFPLVGLWLGF
jgi:hypothetical protein